MFTYNLDEIKNTLTPDQVMDLLSELGGEPHLSMNSTLISRTICHNGDSHKLYYYDNTKLFKCYTGGCAEGSFDIFELVKKVKTREENKEWSLPRAVQFVAQYFGYLPTLEVEDDELRLKDWEIFENYDRIKSISQEPKIVEFEEYDGSFMRRLPHVRILPWLQDGISQSAMDEFEICYEPASQCILIPHHDIEGRLIGIRQRTLIDEVAKQYGKYRPFRLGKQMYNHYLSFALYGLYENQENIIRAKRAIVAEGEKSVLQYETMYGRNNNIMVACCGSSLIQYQVELLKELGVREIIVAFDHDWTSIESEEAQRAIRNLKNIDKKYGNDVTISFIWDRDNILPMKASPTDAGKEIFEELYENRVNLY